VAGFDPLPGECGIPCSPGKSFSAVAVVHRRTQERAPFMPQTSRT
jgi:hypothetical protein